MKGMDIVKYFLPTKEIRMILLTTALFVLFLIIAPFLLKGKERFSFDGYYSLIGGIVGGIITLIVLMLQHTYDCEERREEKLINARGIFEANYSNNLKFEKLRKCQIETEYTGKNSPAISRYLIAKFHGTKNVLNCHVRFDATDSEDSHSDSDIALIGSVVPNQTIAIPMSIMCNKMSISILYRTIAGEIIKQMFLFSDGISSPVYIESMQAMPCNDLIRRENFTAIFSSNKFICIFRSQGNFFEYYDSHAIIN